MRILSLILGLSLLLTACRYEDGPIIAFKSAKKRILGTWQVTEFNHGEEDKMGWLLDEFPINDTMPFVYYPLWGFTTLSGYARDYGDVFINSQHHVVYWAISEDRKTLQINDFYPGDQISYWEIRRLTEDEFWLENYESTDGEVNTLKFRKP